MILFRFLYLPQITTLKTAADSSRNPMCTQLYYQFFLNRADTCNYPKWRTTLFWRFNLETLNLCSFGANSTPCACWVCFIGNEIYLATYMYIFFSYYMFFSIKQMLHTIYCTMIVYAEIVGRGLFNVVTCITRVQSRCVHTIKYV